MITKRLTKALPLAFLVFAISINACEVASETPIEEILVDTQVPPVTNIPAVIQLSTEEEKLSAFFSALSLLLDELESKGTVVEISEDGKGDFVLTHQDGSKNAEIGVVSREDGVLNFTDSNDRASSIPIGQLVISQDTGRLSVIGDKGEIYFSYIPEIFKWRQLIELPYLSIGNEQFSINFGDSWKRDDKFGLVDLVINDQIPNRTFVEPFTGQVRSLSPMERLHLAAEIAQVVSAQATDPSYTLIDLREGKLYSLVTLEGSERVVDPAKGITVYITATRPAGSFYSYPGSSIPINYAWQVDNQRALTMYVVISPLVPELQDGGNFDVLYLKTLLTMMLYQHDEDGRLSLSYSVYSRELPDPYMAELMAELVHELDPVKLADSDFIQDVGKEYAYLEGPDNSLFYLIRGPAP